MLALDLVNTIAVAGVVLFAGYGLRRAVPVLARLNIPAPVVGGLVVAIAMTIAHSVRHAASSASTRRCRRRCRTRSSPPSASARASSCSGSGARSCSAFLLFATAIAILQNVVGAAVALALGEAPLLGVLAGSVTLTGGPATGLAFAPLFEQAGVQGAATVAVAAAMAGIVCGGLIGSPIATLLLERGRVPLARLAEGGRAGARIEPASTRRRVAGRRTSVRRSVG